MELKTRVEEGGSGGVCTPKRGKQGGFQKTFENNGQFDLKNTSAGSFLDASSVQI